MGTNTDEILVEKFFIHKYYFILNLEKESVNGITLKIVQIFFACRFYLIMPFCQNENIRIDTIFWSRLTECDLK